MPEQEKQTPRPGEELVLEREQASQEVGETAVEDASSINSLIIIPPVVIAIIMSFLLALVYGITKEPIAEAKKAHKRDKLVEVMPAFDNDPLDLEQVLTEVSPGKAGNVTLYTGTVEDGTSGYGITSAVGTGYSGYFSVVFGLDIEGNVKAVKILESMETPGLGSKAGEPDFISQFIDKNAGSFNFALTKDGGDIDAITGATITSRAVADAVRQGLDEFEKQDSVEDTPTESPAATELPVTGSWSGGWHRPGGDQ